MKFCRNHWDELCDKIKESGMWELVATSGKESASRVAKGEFDPLMNTHNVISKVALDVIGEDILMEGDGNVCPVCQLKVYDWITGAVCRTKSHLEH